MNTLFRTFPVIFLFFFSVASAQNLVVNPGFENLSADKEAQLCRYSKYADDFSEKVADWNTFSGLTPDIIVYPDSLENCIYPRPRSGQQMIGLILYHPAEDTGYPYDYHEMVQGEFSIPLTAGETYELSFWILQDNAVAVNHLQSVYNRNANVYPVACNNLGVLFLKNPFGENEVIHQSIKQFGIKPHLVFEEVISTTPGKWVRLKTTFVAKSDYEYFVIGNFFSDFRTTVVPDDFEEKFVKKNENNHFFSIAKRIAYYCLDDFEVIRVDPDLISSLTEKQEYTFRNVQFETGKAELLPGAKAELDQLVSWMQDNEGKKIEIAGHTDNVGDETENQVLSEKRAKAVREYLLEKGVAASRIISRGYGESMPRDTNDTPAGRKVNRRVECKILTD